MTIHTRWGSASHLTKWLFDQTDLWITKESVPLKIEDMDLDHVLNTLLMIERMSGADLPVESVQGSPLYQALKDRVRACFPQPEPIPGSILDGPILLCDDKPLTRDFHVTIDVPVARFTAPEAGPAQDELKHRDAHETPAIIALLETWLTRKAEGRSMSAVTIDYRNAEGDATTRDVWPTEITTQPGRFGFSEKRMLKAYDELRDEPRTFRLDRIRWAQGWC